MMANRLQSLPHISSSLFIWSEGDCAAFISEIGFNKFPKQFLIRSHKTGEAVLYNQYDYSTERSQYYALWNGRTLKATLFR